MLEMMLNFLKIWTLSRNYYPWLMFFRQWKNKESHFLYELNSNIIFTWQTTMAFLDTYFITSTTGSLIILTFHFTITFLKSLWSDDSYCLNPMFPEELFPFAPYQFIMHINIGVHCMSQLSPDSILFKTIVA